MNNRRKNSGEAFMAMVVAVAICVVFGTALLEYNPIGGCSNGCQGLPNDPQEEEAYAAGYDDGYDDADSGAGYNGYCYGRGCDPDSSYFWYDEGYDDGYEDGGGRIPAPPDPNPGGNGGCDGSYCGDDCENWVEMVGYSYACQSVAAYGINDAMSGVSSQAHRYSCLPECYQQGYNSVKQQAQ